MPFLQELCHRRIWCRRCHWTLNLHSAPVQLNSPFLQYHSYNPKLSMSFQMIFYVLRGIHHLISRHFSSASWSAPFVAAESSCNKVPPMPTMSLSFPFLEFWDLCFFTSFSSAALFWTQRDLVSWVYRQNVQGLHVFDLFFAFGLPYFTLMHWNWFIWFLLKLKTLFAFELNYIYVTSIYISTTAYNTFT